jgi:hypothetical protein
MQIQRHSNHEAMREGKAEMKKSLKEKDGH